MAMDAPLTTISLGTISRNRANNSSKSYVQEHNQFRRKNISSLSIQHKLGVISISKPLKSVFQRS